MTVNPILTEEQKGKVKNWISVLGMGIYHDGEKITTARSSLERVTYYWDDITGGLYAMYYLCTCKLGETYYSETNSTTPPWYGI